VQCWQTNDSKKVTTACQASQSHDDVHKQQLRSMMLSCYVLIEDMLVAAGIRWLICAGLLPSESLFPMTSAATQQPFWKVS